MKNLRNLSNASFLFFSLFFLLIACQDEPSLRMPATGQEGTDPFTATLGGNEPPNASIGELIPQQEAVDLTAQYQLGNPDQPAAYFIGSSKVQQLLDLPGMVALRWIFGYTSTSELTIIVEPLIETASGTVVADDEQLIQLIAPEGYEAASPYYHGGETPAPTLSVTDGESISLVDAQSLLDTYQLAFAGQGRSYVQGRDLIESLLSSHPTPGLWLFLGEDELSNQEVLVTPSNQGNATPSYLVGDRSSPCPPLCFFTSQLAL
ncbi:MAG: hypothetical protein RIG62_08970 [Cyclobacteriaceae bacterium]